jgi:hypothetical protein
MPRSQVRSHQGGELIESVSAKDKEFHFQNWFQKRLEKLALHFEGSGRNTYPDFSLVEYTEGYEVKGLAWPGRGRDYDSNSQVPDDEVGFGENCQQGVMTGPPMLVRVVSFQHAFLLAIALKLRGVQVQA